jgi:hypothetical protein
MPRVGFEPTIPEFERSKIVHALDRLAGLHVLMGPLDYALEISHNLLRIIREIAAIHNSFLYEVHEMSSSCARYACSSVCMFNIQN